MKEAYKKLRMESSSGKASMNRKITVRQLESLVRLSEALARLYCSETVTAKHVDQAVKLMKDCNKPVIRPDVDLGDELDLDDLDINMEDGSNVLRDRSNVENQQPAQEEGPEIDPEKLKIKYDYYKRVSNMLVLHLRDQEERNSADPDWAGVKQSELSEWFLEMIESDINTQEEYHIQKTIINRLIRKLIKDAVLINLSEDDLNDPSVVAHPDHIVDEDIDVS